MTRAGQAALVILAATLVVVAGLYVVIARQQAVSAERSACVTGYRTDWERAIGTIVVEAAKGNDLSRRQVDRLDAVQRDLKHLDQRCPLRPWWEL